MGLWYGDGLQLFNFDVHEDIRMINDASVEKDEVSSSPNQQCFSMQGSLFRYSKILNVCPTSHAALCTDRNICIRIGCAKERSNFPTNTYKSRGHQTPSVLPSLLTDGPHLNCHAVQVLPADPYRVGFRLDI